MVLGEFPSEEGKLHARQKRRSPRRSAKRPDLQGLFVRHVDDLVPILGRRKFRRILAVHVLDFAVRVRLATREPTQERQITRRIPKDDQSSNLVLSAVVARDVNMQPATIRVMGLGVPIDHASNPAAKFQNLIDLTVVRDDLESFITQGTIVFAMQFPEAIYLLSQIVPVDGRDDFQLDSNEVPTFRIGHAFPTLLVVAENRSFCFWLRLCVIAVIRFPEVGMPFSTRIAPTIVIDTVNVERVATTSIARIGIFLARLTAVFAVYRGEIIPSSASAMLALTSLIPALFTVPTTVVPGASVKKLIAAMLAGVSITSAGFADLLARYFLQFLVHFAIAAFTHSERRTLLAHRSPLSSFNSRLFLG